MRSEEATGREQDEEEGKRIGSVPYSDGSQCPSMLPTREKPISDGLSCKKNEGPTIETATKIRRSAIRAQARPTHHTYPSLIIDLSASIQQQRHHTSIIVSTCHPQRGSTILYPS
jgi:hypothetical protein